MSSPRNGALPFMKHHHQHHCHQDQLLPRWGPWKLFQRDSGWQKVVFVVMSPPNCERVHRYSEPTSCKTVHQPDPVFTALPHLQPSALNVMARKRYLVARLFHACCTSLRRKCCCALLNDELRIPNDAKLMNNSKLGNRIRFYILKNHLLLSVSTCLWLTRIVLRTG